MSPLHKGETSLSLLLFCILQGVMEGVYPFLYHPCNMKSQLRYVF